MTTPLRVHLVDQADPVAELGRDVESAVFDETFGNSRDLLDDEYGPYLSGTFFAVVEDAATGDGVGSMRLIVDNPAGFKSLNDVESGPWATAAQKVLEDVDVEPTALVDVATLSVRAVSRRSGDAYGNVTAVLFFALRAFKEAHGITDLVAILDDAVLTYLNQVGVALAPVAGLASAPYLGSPGSTPVHGNFAEMEVALGPELFRTFCLGEGLLGNVADASWLDVTTGP